MNISTIRLENKFNIAMWKLLTFLIIETIIISYLIIKGKLIFAFIALLGSFFIGTILFYNQIGFLVILFIQYSSIIMYLFEGKDHYFRYFVLLVMGCWVLNKLIHKDLKAVTDKLQIFVLLFWLLVLISYTYALNPTRSIEYIWKSTALFLIYFVFFLDVFKTKKDFKWIFRSVIISLFVLSIMGLYFYIANFEIIIMGLMEEKVARTTSLMNDPNHYALALITMLPFPIYYFANTKSKLLKVVLIIGTLLVLFSIFVTFSRGALVSLFIMILYMLYRERRIKHVFLILTGILLVILVFLWFFPIFFEHFVQRVELLSNGIDYSVSQRFLVLKGGINMFLNHPFFGVGAGNFIVYSPGYIFLTKPKYAHNNYLEIGAEMGIVGISLFILIIVMTFINLRKSQILFFIGRRHDFYRMSKAVELGFVGLLIGSLFLSRPNDPYFWSVIAFSIILNKLSTNLN